MIIKADGHRVAIFTQIEDGFKREDARLTQLLAKTSRRFVGKVTSLYDPDATYNKSQQKIAFLDDDIIEDVVSMIRLCGVVVNVEEKTH